MTCLVEHQTPLWTLLYSGARLRVHRRSENFTFCIASNLLPPYATDSEEFVTQGFNLRVTLGLRPLQSHAEIIPIWKSASRGFVYLNVLIGRIPANCT
jgi:hypothetical protein